MRTRALSAVLLLALTGLPGAEGSARAEPPGAASGPDGGARAMTEDEAAPEAAPDESAPARSPAPIRREAGPPERRTHTVAAGDTLGGIAHHYGITTAALALANGITSATPIRIGQTLNIPAAGETVRAPTRVHVVAQGNTLASIAKSYGVSVETILKANHIDRKDRLQIGQKLVISGDTPLPTTPEKPEKFDEPSPPASASGMQQLDIPGTSGPAYYFEPTGPGHNSMRPVIVYVHGRGAEPAKYCKRWARVARNLGWLVCPSGPEDRGDGKRGWSNNWYSGKNIVMSAIDGLRKKYGRRVQLYGNTLVGFSEGAFVAMNVGLREPHTFNRWLILGADTDYWGAAGVATLPEARGRVRRVYLITGRHDDVVGDADEVRKWLVKAGVPVRVSTPKDMGHEVALEAKPAMYQAALRWLAQG
jgi:LysM repeat protein/predicted esterase